jgi:hypothetical protein
MERAKTHKYRKLLSGTATVTLAAALTSHISIAQNTPAPIPPSSVCSQNVNTLALPPAVDGRSQPQRRWRYSV